MSREIILARIRAALGEVPKDPRGDAGSAPDSLKGAGGDTVSRFTAAANAKSISVIVAPNPHGVPETIARHLKETGVTERRLRTAGLPWPGLPWSQAGLDLTSGAATLDDTIGLSRALAGIAETGTVMLSSGTDNPTTLGFLPVIHIVVLDRAAVVGTFEEATAILRTYCGADSLPRTVNFISGASRTGDIGGRIVHGAHGPRHLAVVLVENKQGAARAP